MADNRGCSLGAVGLAFVSGGLLGAAAALLLAPQSGPESQKQLRGYARRAEEGVHELADKASDRNAARLPDLVAALDDPHPVMRYWAATGCLILQGKAAPAKAKLLARLADDFADVRVVAAEALVYFGETEAALKTLGWPRGRNSAHADPATRTEGNEPGRQGGAGSPANRRLATAFVRGGISSTPALDRPAQPIL